MEEKLKAQGPPNRSEIRPQSYRVCQSRGHKYSRGIAQHVREVVASLAEEWLHGEAVPKKCIASAEMRCIHCNVVVRAMVILEES